MSWSSSSSGGHRPRYLLSGFSLARPRLRVVIVGQKAGKVVVRGGGLRSRWSSSYGGRGGGGYGARCPRCGTALVLLVVDMVSSGLVISRLGPPRLVLGSGAMAVTWRIVVVGQKAGVVVRVIVGR
jgi:hypothetical protein